MKRTDRQRSIDEEILEEVWLIATQSPIFAQRGKEPDELMVQKLALALTDLASQAPATRSAPKNNRRRLLLALDTTRHLKKRLKPVAETYIDEVERIERRLVQAINDLPELRRLKPGPAADEKLKRATESVCCTLGERILSRGGQSVVRSLLDVGWVRVADSALSETRFRDHYWRHGKDAATFTARASRAFHKASKAAAGRFTSEGITVKRADCSFDGLVSEYLKGREAVSLELSLIRDDLLAKKHNVALRKINAMLGLPARRSRPSRGVRRRKSS
ncbi:MAG: hypothetical protein PHU25_15195 [Deltaproteobacteria bacterium]|nr:hypothetical protein [Deltaproteobacteria bacterium]